MGTKFGYVCLAPLRGYLSSLSRQSIEGLETLVNLEELWLGKNKITRLEVRCLLVLSFGYASSISLKGLGTLKKLKILSIQSNRITKLEGLEELVDLDQLYLSHNGIKQIEGLEKNVRVIPHISSA